LSSLEVDLWPEYDRTEMLVIYRIVLPPDVLPAELSFRIPKAVGKPYKVAVRAEDDNLYEVEADYQESEGWGLVTFSTTVPEVQLEYYDPGLEKQGATRRFEYRWSGDYAVDTTAIVIQQPLGASNMRFSSETVSTFNGADDLTYYGVQVGALAAGQTYDFSMSYQKSSDTLTKETLGVRPSGPIPQITILRVLPWVLMVLAVGLIVVGVWIYWRLGRPEVSVKKRRRRSSSSSQVEESTPTEGVYCHMCGRRAGSGDQFCRACGTRLRAE
jgi:hypothetical protein